MAQNSVSTPGYVNFKLWRGDTFTRSLVITDDENVAWDISELTFKFYIFENIEKAAILTLEETQGITIQANQVTLTLTPTQTSGLFLRSYAYELEVTNQAGQVRTWLAGEIEVLARPE